MAWLFQSLRKLKILAPAERLSVRHLGHSIIGRQVTSQAGVPYVPTLLLRTVGRRSGVPRDVPLFYFEDGESFVIVASKGGAPQHPLWFVNLEADPEVTVWAKRRRVRARAAVARGSERERLWKIVTHGWPAYDDYQKRAGDREIPVVVLHLESGENGR